MSKLLDGLNPSQQKAVTHTIGPLLIIAGPGSGKTRTVVRSIAYAIENSVQPDRILAFSFTVKASQELRERVTTFVGEEEGQLVSISTFHSFCRKVLKEDLGQLYKTELPNFQDLDEDQQEKEDRRRVDRAINDLQYNESVKSENVLNFIVKCKALGIRPSEVGNDTPNPEYARIYEKYEQRLKEDGWIDYSNQQLFTDELFKIPEVKTKWQKKYELIFVDEYQDTDPVQDRIIKALAEKHRNLRVVGDDDQGIYGWRGADIQNILKFEEEYLDEEERPDKVILLGQNYRSTKKIVAASGALADFNPERRDKELFTGNCEGEWVKYFHCENDEEEASTIANFVHRAKEQGSRSPNDFAVLYRNNKQARAFKKAFKDLEIQYRVVGDSAGKNTIGVSLMTIHKSKGLEFPNVFVAGVCKDLLPNYHSRHAKDWDEELRLLYVAMTRAKNWLCLSSYDKKDRYPRGPSPFLEYIPSHLLKSVDTLENVGIPPCPKEMDVLRDSEGATEYVEQLPQKLLGDGMTVLGVDPGNIGAKTTNVGWSITQKSRDAYAVVEYDTLKLEKNGAEYKQKQIERKINELIASYRPHAIAVEKIEVGESKGKREATKEDWFLYVAGCVATIKSTANQHGIKYDLYTPQQVKYTATNNREASKQEVQEGVMRICSNLQQIPEPHHSADAIAASLCYLRSYLNSSRFEGNKRKQKLYKAGCDYLDEKEYEKAIDIFKETINIDPIYTEARYGLGRAYLAQGKLEAAEEACKEGLRLAENNADAQKALGAIKGYRSGQNLLDNREYEAATEKFTEIINIEPIFIDAYCGLSRAYLGAGNVENAKSAAEEARKLNNDYHPIRNLLDAIESYDSGHDFLNNKQYEVAIEKFQAAIDKEHIFVDAHYGLGQAHFKTGALEDAEQSANEALDLRDESYQLAYKLLEDIKQAYVKRGYAYLEMGKLEAAEEDAKGALRLNNNCQEAKRLLEKIKQKHQKQGLVYMEDEEYAKAIKSLLKAYSIDPNDKGVCMDLGDTYCFTGSNADAAKYYREVTEIDPNDKIAYIELSNAYCNMEEYSKVIDSLQKARNLDPNCAKTCSYLARVHLELKNWEQAKLNLKKSLHIDPTDPAAIKLLKDKRWPADRHMKKIPAGEFLMRGPGRTVYVNEFYIDIYLVTNAQYKKFVEENPEWQKINIPDELHDGNYLKRWNKNNYRDGEAYHPVVYINWHAAKAYAEWAGKRLPTAIEWKKAASGNSIVPTKANYDSKIGWTTPVAKYDPNGYGLYDMIGNVWEWCDDCNNTSYRTKNKRILHGGSWRTEAHKIRTNTINTSDIPSKTREIYGFRCARSITS